MHEPYTDQSSTQTAILNLVLCMQGGM